jgi:hypothetical protein
MNEYLRTDLIVVFALAAVYYFGFLHGQLKKYLPKNTPPKNPPEK